MMEAPLQHATPVSRVLDSQPQTTQMPSIEELLSSHSPSGQTGYYSSAPRQLMKKKKDPTSEEPQQTTENPPQQTTGNTQNASLPWRILTFLADLVTPYPFLDYLEEDENGDEDSTTLSQAVPLATAVKTTAPAPAAQVLTPYKPEREQLTEILGSFDLRLPKQSNIIPKQAKKFLKFFNDKSLTRKKRTLATLCSLFNFQDDAVFKATSLAKLPNWSDDAIIELARGPKKNAIERLCELASLPPLLNNPNGVILVATSPLTTPQITLFFKEYPSPVIDSTDFSSSLQNWTMIIQCFPEHIFQSEQENVLSFTRLLKAGWEASQVVQLLNIIHVDQTPDCPYPILIKLINQTHSKNADALGTFAKLTKFKFERIKELLTAYLNEPPILPPSAWSSITSQAKEDIPVTDLLPFIRMTTQAWTTDELIFMVSHFTPAHHTSDDWISIMKACAAFVPKETFAVGLAALPYEINTICDLIRQIQAKGQTALWAHLLSHPSIGTLLPLLLSNWNLKLPQELVDIFPAYLFAHPGVELILDKLVQLPLTIEELEALKAGNFSRFGLEEDRAAPDMEKVSAHYASFFPPEGVTIEPVILSEEDQTYTVGEGRNKSTIHYFGARHDHILAGHTLGGRILTTDFCLKRELIPAAHTTLLPPEGSTPATATETEDIEMDAEGADDLDLSFFLPGTDIDSLLRDSIAKLDVSKDLNGYHPAPIVEVNGGKYQLPLKQMDSHSFCIKTFYPVEHSHIQLSPETLLAIKVLHDKKLKLPKKPQPPSH